MIQESLSGNDSLLQLLVAPSLPNATAPVPSPASTLSFPLEGTP